MTSRFEFLVRGAQLGGSRLGGRNLPQIRVPPGATGEAVHRWGRKANFLFTAPGTVTTVVIFNDLPDIDDPDGAARIFTETVREVDVVRVTNPSDSAQFVDVERIKRISFRGEDGIISTFRLNN